MKFVKGDKVEVCSKEEGYLGSYFEAKVLSKLPHGNFYKVKYKNLVTEGEDPIPLIEVISADELRPLPPKLSQPSLFNLHDKVDAYANEGWWVGYVSAVRGHLYTVYFATTNEECHYPIYSLRRHLEFVHGRWVTSVTRQRQSS